VHLLVAYLDAGSGSVILQALAGGVAGFAVMGKLYWRRLKRLVVRRDASGEAP
jgi:outer membrane lipoprotein SlyB